MTPKNLLKLAEHKLCVTEFYTSTDPTIEVNIMRVNSEAGFAIISSDKQLDSKLISARFYANNSIYEVDFTIDSELAIGNQFSIKLPSNARDKKKGIIINSYGGINISSPVPSLKIGGSPPKSDEINLHYFCHVIGDGFLIVQNDGIHSLKNLQDCIDCKQQIDIIMLDRETYKLSAKSVHKISDSFIKVEVEGVKSLKAIASYFSAEIEHALTVATINKKHIIESLNE